MQDWLCLGKDYDVDTDLSFMRIYVHKIPALASWKSILGQINETKSHQEIALCILTHTHIS